MSHANAAEYDILGSRILNKQLVISDDENNGGHEPVGVAVLPGDRELLLDLQRRMLEIRCFEDEVMRLFMLNLVRGSTHLYQGQEAVAVGACSALREGDTMTCTYRGHGAVLAMGAPLDRTMAEILGKAELRPGHRRIHGCGLPAVFAGCRRAAVDHRAEATSPPAFCRTRRLPAPDPHAGSVVAAWLVASTRAQRRNIGFWVFLASNVLWTVWGWHTSAWALIESTRR